jgi:hypothetical protein
MLGTLHFYHFLKLVVCIGTKYVSHDRWDYKEFIAVNVLKSVFLDLVCFVCYTCNVSTDTAPLNYTAEWLDQSVLRVSYTNETDTHQFVASVEVCSQSHTELEVMISLPLLESREDDAKEEGISSSVLTSQAAGTQFVYSSPVAFRSLDGDAMSTYI